MRRNNAGRVITEAMIRTIRSFFDGNLPDRIDRIPVDMRPKTQSPMRCCIYKDRAMLRYRLMAVLGFMPEDEYDESKFLMEYLSEAESRTEYTNCNVLGVIDMACEGCVESQYIVTNACRGCFARPCVGICPKQAIELIDGHAKIDRTKCIDCGKCTSVCPYSAIVRVPIPCEEACPVNAIRKDQNGKEKIDFSRCIYCGKCMVACPFAAIIERSQLIDVLVRLRRKEKVVAMVAPAIAGQFAGTLNQIAAALNLAGFHATFEVANGAEETTRHEASEFAEKINNGDSLMTSSCCPAYVQMVKKHVPQLLKYVSSTPSPMRFSAARIKRKSPDCTTVFIGPCVAKRHEAIDDVNTDYVLTFEELGAIFAALEIDVASQKEAPLSGRNAHGYARNFATSCGVTSAILHDAGKLAGEGIKMPEVNGKFLNGLDRKSVGLLKLYAENKLPGNFLEAMACVGGCVGGPCALCDAKVAMLAVKKSADMEK